MCTAWRETSARIAPLVAERGDDLGIVEADLARLDAAILAGDSPAKLLATTQSLRHERGERVLARLADQAASIAARVGRCAIETQVRHGGERFPREAWAPVWSALVHAVRNAVDHGTQLAAERVAQGKPEAMRLVFESIVDPSGLRIRIEDDGAGVDWERVRDRARSRGLRTTDPSALHDALFVDGLSTRDEASDLSGRGVGLAALRDACAQVQATVRVQSTRGTGD